MNSIGKYRLTRPEKDEVMTKREIGTFLMVGSLTVLVDFAVYRTFLWLWALGIEFAKGIGFIAGTLFAYFANRFCTFGGKQHASGSAWRFALLYMSTLGANVTVNAITLKLLMDFMAALQLSFLTATGVSATLNFIGMKFFVFKSRAAQVLT